MCVCTFPICVLLVAWNLLTKPKLVQKKKGKKEKKKKKVCSFQEEATNILPGTEMSQILRALFPTRCCMTPHLLSLVFLTEIMQDFFPLHQHNIKCTIQSKQDIFYIRNVNLHQFLFWKRVIKCVCSSPTVHLRLNSLHLPVLRFSVSNF